MRDNLHQQLDEIAQVTDQVPRIKLYVPVLFDQTQLREIGTWVRNEIGEHTLLQLSVDAASVGGATVIWNGVRHEFSLAYFLQQHRQEVISNLRQMSEQS